MGDLNSNPFFDEHTKDVKGKDGKTKSKIFSWPNFKYDPKKDDELGIFTSLLNSRYRRLRDNCVSVFSTIESYEWFYNVQKLDNILSLPIAKKLKQPSSYNVIRAVENTFNSKINKENPKIYFLTENGTPELQQVGKDVDQFVESEFLAGNIYKETRKVTRSASISKNGYLKAFLNPMTQKWKFEHIRSTNILVDDSNEMYERKKEMFERRVVNKYHLKEMFPKKAEMIDKIQEDENEKEIGDQNVILKEAFYEGKRHVIWAGNVIFLDEAWDDVCPYFKYQVNSSTNSYFGVCHADDLFAIQIRINDILRKISRSMDLFATPRVFIHRMNDIIKTKLQNEIGAVTETNGRKPEFFTPSVLSSEYFHHLADLFQKAFQITGVSLSSAASMKPAGLESGKALRTYHDIESQRFNSNSKDLQDFYVEIARFVVRQSDKYFSKKRSKDIKNVFVKKIKWDSLDIDRDIYRLQTFPVNLLSDDPASRTDEISFLLNLAVITPEDATSLLNYADIKKVKNQVVSTKDATWSLMSRLVKGEAIAPDPYLQLDYQLSTAEKFYARAVADEVKEDTLQKIRDFIDACGALLDAQAEQQSLDQANEIDKVKKRLDPLPPEAQSAV